MERSQAQARADRIRAFRDELVALEREGVVRLGDAERTSVARHHDTLLAELASAYDIDRSVEQHQLSLGMRVVSLLGAAALTAAVLLFFQRIWGLMPSSLQVIVTWTAPIVLVWAASRVARTERTGYFTALVSFVALGCFVLNVVVVGTIFNMGESSSPFLAFALFAFALAYAWDLSWMLAAGLLSLLAFFAATVVSWMGHPIDISLQRPETLLVPGAVVFFLAGLPVHARWPRFPPVYRRVGLIAAFLPALFLTVVGEVSYLPFGADTVEAIYQIAGFAAAAAAMLVGLRRRWPETLNIAAVFFGLLMLFRFVDWWWEWLPQYLFFLIVGAMAVLFLFALRRLRQRVSGVSADVEVARKPLWS
jgi:hypothetical protein